MQLLGHVANLGPMAIDPSSLQAVAPAIKGACFTCIASIRKFVTRITLPETDIGIPTLSGRDSADLDARVVVSSTLSAK